MRFSFQQRIFLTPRGSFPKIMSFFQHLLLKKQHASPQGGLFEEPRDHTFDGVEIFLVCRKPEDFGVGFKPGDLTLGISAGVPFNEMNRLLEGKVPEKMRKDVPVSK